MQYIFSSPCDWVEIEGKNTLSQKFWWQLKDTDSYYFTKTSILKGIGWCWHGWTCVLQYTSCFLWKICKRRSWFDMENTLLSILSTSWIMNVTEYKDLQSKSRLLNKVYSFKSYHSVQRICQEFNQCPCSTESRLLIILNRVLKLLICDNMIIENINKTPYIWFMKAL